MVEESTPLFDSEVHYHLRYGSNLTNSGISNLETMSDVDSDGLHMQEKLRWKLRYHLMNPIEKWKAKGKIPWKLGLQISKIVIITIQLGLFGSDSYEYEQRKYDTVVAFRHTFLKGWNNARDVTSYPPTLGTFAVYTKLEFFESINYVIDKHSTVGLSSIGSYDYDTDNGSISSVLFCATSYRNGKIWAYNATLEFDSTEVQKCEEIPPLYPAGDKRWHQFSIQNYLKKRNSSVNFDSLIEASLKFHLNAVYLKSVSRFNGLDCYRYTIIITYDNRKHDGQMVVALNTNTEKIDCHFNVEYSNDKYHYILRQLLNALVIFLCLVSLMLCARSIYRAQLLRQKTIHYFRNFKGKALSFQDQLSFFDLWYVMIIINDIFIIVGSAIKIELEHNAVEGDQYNTCSIFLGIGNLLVWAGVLRYLGFFKKYNILILTVKRALPNVMRFMLCAILLYGGFCFCGWVVLGPYHIKFRSLSSTSECLFSMMNGDDLFATFAIINTQSSLIWWFSRLYLYLFISLFIYVVISLFISVIMDSYETIKEVYESGIPSSHLQSFIDGVECSEQD